MAMPFKLSVQLYVFAYTVPDPAVSFPWLVTKTVWLLAGQVHNIVFVLFSVWLKEKSYQEFFSIGWLYINC